MLDSTDLSRFLERNGIPAEVVRLPVHTPTVEAAAAAVGTGPERIVKSLLFIVDERPVLVIACGPDRVDPRPIAAHYGVGRKRVKLADAETVVAVTGYAVGAVPPFGHPQPLETLLDLRVLEFEQVYAGGGAIDALLRIDPKEILRAARVTTLTLKAPADVETP